MSEPYKHFQPPHTPSWKIWAFTLSLLTFALAIQFCACTPAQSDAWKRFGLDEAKCAGVGLVEVAGSALTDLLGHVYNDDVANFNPDSILSDTKVKYGPQAVNCALGKAASDLLPLVTGDLPKASVTPRARKMQMLVDANRPKAVDAGVK